MLTAGYFKQVPSGGAVAAAPAAGGGAAAAADAPKEEEKEEEKVRISDIKHCCLSSNHPTINRRNPTTIWALVFSTNFSLVPYLLTLRIARYGMSTRCYCQVYSIYTV